MHHNTVSPNQPIDLNFLLGKSFTFYTLRSTLSVQLIITYKKGNHLLEPYSQIPLIHLQIDVQYYFYSKNRR